MPYLLGVDGGATGTTAVLSELDGTILASASGGASNFLVVGRERAAQNLRTVIQQVLEGCDPRDCYRATVGLAALADENDRRSYFEMLLPLNLGGEILIESDVVIAWAAATSGQAGIGVIAGTGSSCFGINAKGERWRCLGWDYVLADQGSGYWIGLRGIQAAIKVFDGRIPNSLLLPAMLDQYNLKKAEEMLTFAYRPEFTKQQIAQFARRVFECAERGDPYALSIVDSAAEELAQAVIGTAQKLDMMRDSFPVGLIGGTFNAGDIIIKPLRLKIGAKIAHAGVRIAPYPAVIGALIWGEQQQGHVTIDFLSKLRTSGEAEKMRAK